MSEDKGEPFRLKMAKAPVGASVRREKVSPHRPEWRMREEAFYDARGSSWSLRPFSLQDAQ
ncbi:hypothetical protein GCM10010988_33740 [Cnuibacter physcomitrellae]|nr:hypothetical protein GCM10010988_33740 [Cnuibacter physcomitrellae]